MAKFYGHKKVPSYWWDYEGDNGIIVESNIEGKLVIARFSFDPEWKFGCAEQAIQQAERLIKDLNEGRISLKDVLDR